MTSTHHDHVVFFLFFQLLHCAVESVSPVVCSVSPSFDSPSVVPYWEVAAPVVGCTSRTLAHKSQEVHVIYLMNKAHGRTTTLPEVNLHIEPFAADSVHEGRLVVILHAQRDVQWRVFGDRISNASHHTIVVTRRSRIIENKNLPIMVLNRPEMVIGRVITWVTRRFKAVTSYAEVKDSKDIFLEVGVSNDSPNECNMDDKMASPNVQALAMEPVPVEYRSGCLVDDLHAFPRPEVHVIHLCSDDKSKGNGNVNDSAVPRLEVSLEIRARSNVIEENNMILVMKADQPVVWRIQSSNIRGALKIVTEGPVERDYVPTNHLVQVKTEELPENSDDLIFYADNKYGPLLSYLEVKGAKKFEVLVGDGPKSVTGIAHTSTTSPTHQLPTETKLPRQTGWLQQQSRSALPNMPSSKDFFKAQLGSIRSSKLTGVQVLLKSKGRSNPDDLIRMSPHVLLMDAMQVDCLPKFIHVSFPKRFIEGLGYHGNGMTLNDPLCRLLPNNTHYHFTSPFKSCGMEIVHLDDKVIYKNAINFHSPGRKVGSEAVSSIIREADLLIDDEDHTAEEGSGYGSTHIDEDTIKPKLLEFQCKYSTSGLPLLNPGDQDVNFNINSPHSQIYSLDLYRDEEYRTSIKSIDFPLNVVENDRLFVESRIDAGPHLRVVTDECWLSGSINATDEPRIPLVRNTCPTDVSIQMERIAAHNPKVVPTIDDLTLANVRQWNHFSFQVNSEYLKFGALYLHCMLGVCTINPEHTPGSIKQCVNVEDYCASPNLRPFLDRNLGTNHEVLTRGPIHILPESSLRIYKDFFSSVGPFLAREKKPDIKNTMSNFGERGEEKIVIQEQPQLILIGLSTEAVVGIAFASFVIGAGLTGILWFIHLRTDPTRNARNCGSASHHSGYDLSAHSGSSTPSSQVPMTT